LRTGRRRRLRLLAAPGERPQPARPRGAQAPCSPARLGTRDATLPASMRREISTLSFLYRWTLPDCLLPTADSPYEGFDVEIRRLRRLRTEAVAFDLLRRLYDHGGGARPGRHRILGSPEVRALALKQAGVIGPASRRAAALLFDDPSRLVDRFASLLEAYWEAAF